VRVEPVAAKDCAQRDDDRRGVVVAAHLADKAASGFERPADAGEDGIRRAHPMERRVREHRVELAVEGKALPAHDTRIDAAGPRRGDHVWRPVDGND
jgi:hypothetical protein